MSNIPKNFFSLFVLLFLVNSFVFSQETEKISKDSVRKLLNYSFRLGEKHELSASLENAIIALEKAKEVKDDTLIARAYNTIGVTYARLYEREKAYKFILQASELQRKIQDSTNLTRSLNNLGILHYYKKEYDKALPFYNNALVMAKQLDDIRAQADPLFNIARLYLDQGKVLSAQKFFENSINISKQIPERKRNLAYSYTLYGKALLELNLLDQALEKLNIAIKLNTEEQYYDLNNQAYELKAKVYAAKNNYEEANKALQKQVENVKKEYDLKKVITEERLTIQYELEETEEELKAFQNETIEQTKTIKKFKTLAMVIGLLTFMLIGIIYLLQRKKNELALAKEQSEQAAQIKANFFSIISHELRTPLYAVIAITDLLQKEKPRDDQKEYLTSLKFSGDHLLALIDNVLQINKMDAKKSEVEQNAFDLNLLVLDIIDSLDQTTKSKNNCVHTVIDAKIPKFIIGDSLKVSQVLINLIGNAIKFTENGNIWVKVSSVKETQSTVTLHFSIEDDGIGISKKKQKLIFEDFSQESMLVNRKYGGTGLGLAIVKKILNILNTTISVESEEGKGAKFYFDITFKKAPTVPVIQAEVVEIDYAKLKGLKALIVDDNNINQLLTKKILERKEVACTIVDSGFEALKLLKTETFDIIFMDIHMPEMDGYQTTEKIRMFDNVTPIIAFTANSLEDTGERVKDFGMDDFITKPFKMEEFYEKILLLIENFKS